MKSMSMRRRYSKQKPAVSSSQPRLLKLIFSKESVSSMFGFCQPEIQLDSPAWQPGFSLLCCKISRQEVPSPKEIQSLHPTSVTVGKEFLRCHGTP